ncbi:MAG: ABC transporter ATP-binding protein [Gemmatimonadaceae bacterium]
MITLNDVSVRAGAFALKRVSFSIPAGKFGVVVGAAGSGKTTMLEAIAGVRPLTSGSIALHAHTVTDWPPEKRAVGLVYQHGALFPHRSVGDNIAWSVKVSRRAGDAALEADRTAIVNRLGIAALYGTPVSALSGGERQLVALARALLRVRACLHRAQPAVLLLDEPFSALDPRRRVATREIVHAVHREWNLTTLMVTHDSIDARRADVAVLLDGGEVVQSGAPQELLNAPVRDDVAYFLNGDA